MYTQTYYKHLTVYVLPCLGSVTEEFKLSTINHFHKQVLEAAPFDEFFK